MLFGSCFGTGLTSQLAEMAISFNGMAGVDLRAVTGEGEQYPALFELLRDNAVTFTVIPGLDKHGGFRRKTAAVRDVIAHFGPDAMLAQTNWQQAIAYLGRRYSRHRCLLIHTIHGYRHNEPLKSWLARLLIGAGLYATADVVITPSSFLRRKFSLLGSRLRTIYLGEDRLFFDDYVPPPSEGMKHLVFPAQFRRGKHQDLLIRAVGRYVKETGDDQIRLHLPGRGDRLTSCQKLALDLGLQEQVIFPGFLDREDMVELYKRCACALVPSNVETFGHCVVEPFILGRVVISRPVGVAPDIIRHGENGFLWETEDELLSILKELLGDPNRMRGICSRAFAERDAFKWETICQQHIDIINSLGFGS